MVPATRAQECGRDYQDVPPQRAGRRGAGGRHLLTVPAEDGPVEAAEERPPLLVRPLRSTKKIMRYGVKLQSPLFDLDLNIGD